MESTSSTIVTENQEQQKHPEEEEEEDNNYSEWRAFFDDGRVTVNKGFQVQDFQSVPGGPSVIDAEHFRTIYGDLIGKEDRIKRLDCLSVPIGFMVIPFGVSWILDHFFNHQTQRLNRGLITLSVFILFVIMTTVKFCITKGIVRTKKDFIQTIENQKSFFLEAYDIELGLGNWDTGKVNSDDDSPIYGDGFYLRRHRRMSLFTHHEASEGRHHLHHHHHEVVRIEDSAPIFFKPFMPGDLDISMPYDASSMMVDAMTWEFLQSTHDAMTMTSLCCTFIGLIISGAGLYAIILAFRWSLDCGMIVLGAFFVFLELYSGSRSSRWWLRSCEEKARIMTQRLQQDKDKADWIVEFHSSDLPGREPIGHAGRLIITMNDMRLRDTHHWVPSVHIVLVVHNTAPETNE